ncbi:MAG: zinc ribbon-containing protein [Dehalococcoidia bacterium]
MEPRIREWIVRDLGHAGEHPRHPQRRQRRARHQDRRHLQETLGHVLSLLHDQHQQLAADRKLQQQQKGRIRQRGNAHGSLICTTCHKHATAGAHRGQWMSVATPSPNPSPTA